MTRNIWSHCQKSEAIENIASFSVYITAWAKCPHLSNRFVFGVPIFPIPPFFTKHTGLNPSTQYSCSRDCFGSAVLEREARFLAYTKLPSAHLNLLSRSLYKIFASFGEFGLFYVRYIRWYILVPSPAPLLLPLFLFPCSFSKPNWVKAMKKLPRDLTGWAGSKVSRQPTGLVRKK